MNVHVHQLRTADGAGQGMTVRLPLTPETPAEARRAVLEFLSPRYSPRAVRQLLIVTSELVTNAVKYGDGDSVWLYVTSTDADVSITVTNSGQIWSAPSPVLERVAPGSGFEDLDEGGRGLPIVASLCDRLHVFCGVTTVVRAAKRFAQDELRPRPLGHEHELVGAGD